MHLEGGGGWAGREAWRGLGDWATTESIVKRVYSVASWFREKR